MHREVLSSNIYCHPDSDTIFIYHSIFNIFPASIVISVTVIPVSIISFQKSAFHFPHCHISLPDLPSGQIEYHHYLLNHYLPDVEVSTPVVWESSVSVPAVPSVPFPEFCTSPALLDEANTFVFLSAV